LDKGAKIKGKEKNNEVIKQWIHARVFGTHKHKLGLNFDA
jgi:hypothetical protein